MLGEEIQRRLVDFARKWSLFDGSERSEAQTFLNELFACFGTDRGGAGARFEEPEQGKFVDLVWPRRCIIEMKRPSEAGQPGAYPNAPRAEFSLLALPDRRDALMFLAGREPVFVASQEAVTRQAVQLMTNLYHRLGDRMAAPPDVRQRFLLQSMWCLFAEDLGQLEGHIYTRIVDGLIADGQRSSVDDLGGLFSWLNRPGPRPEGGLYADTRYVNGGLFEEPAEIHLEHEELLVLRMACEYDWRKVEPHIFGSLLQGTLGQDAQHALGNIEHRGHRDRPLRGVARAGHALDGSQARRRRA